MSPNKRVKLQLINGKIRFPQAPQPESHIGDDAFHIVINKKGRMHIPIKIEERKGK